MGIVKRLVEVFTAGCPICEGTVRLVKSLICPSCELKVYDLREGCTTNECREKATQYGITAMPAIVVNGVLLDCCLRGLIDRTALVEAGIGQG